MARGSVQAEGASRDARSTWASGTSEWCCVRAGHAAVPELSGASRVRGVSAEVAFRQNDVKQG